MIVSSEIESLQLSVTWRYWFWILFWLICIQLWFNSVSISCKYESTALKALLSSASLGQCYLQHGTYHSVQTSNLRLLLFQTKAAASVPTALKSRQVLDDNCFSNDKLKHHLNAERTQFSKIKVFVHIFVNVSHVPSRHRF